MKGTAAALLAALIALTACAAPGRGQRSQSDQDRDGRLIAKAIQEADAGGATFTMTEAILLSGGDIPSGQQAQVRGSASGSLFEGRAHMDYKFARTKNSVRFEVIVAEGGFFIRPGPAAAWSVTPEPAVTELYPAVRLPLIRESVLLAKSVGGSSIQHLNSGFTHKYAVVPAPDQLEQLDAMPVTGAAETAFLKTAVAEFDIFLTSPGDHLARVEVHLTGTDPSSGTRQKIDCTADFKQARVTRIEPPAQANPVKPNQIFGS